MDRNLFDMAHRAIERKREGRVTAVSLLYILFMLFSCLTLQTLYANDNCADALQISCSQTIKGSTIGALPDSLGYCEAGIAPAIWYFITGTGDSITISTCSDSTNYDTQLSVFEGSCLGLSCVGFNDDDACTFDGTHSRFSWLSNAGVTYYIMVHGYNDNSGEFELAVDCKSPSACDTFSLSTNVTQVSAVTANDGAVDLSVSGGTPPYAYFWSTGAVTQDIFDLVAGAYTVTVSSTNGCVAIDTAFVSSPNNDCVNAHVLTVNAYNNCSGNETLGTTAGATSEGNDPFCDEGGLPQDVWYTFNSGFYTELLLSINHGTNTISSYEIFDECGVPDTIVSPGCDWVYNNNLQQVLSGFPGSPSTYYLRVWSSPGFEDMPGTFDICLSEVLPPCDSFLLAFDPVNPGAPGGSDGAIDLTVSGGASPYSYHWSNGAVTEDITGLSAGTYFITVISSDSCMAVDTVELSDPICTTQDIGIMMGWNMISSYINPDNADMNSVFSAIVSDILLVKNTPGETLIPAFGINQIGDWKIREGYKVKAANATTLTMGCELIDPASVPISLAAGWNMIAYLRSTAMDVSLALNGIEDDIILVKNNLGQTFIPNFGINLIGNMQPGQGYKVKMGNATTLTYPGNVSKFNESNVAEYRKPVHYVSWENTGHNATVIIPSAALSEAVTTGDEIGVFSENGELSGAGVYEKGNLAITVWGDDLTTQDDIEGMATGENFQFRIWKSKEAIELPANAAYQSGEKNYVNDGITVLKKLDMENIFLSDDLVFNCYPNPTSGRIYFDFELSAESDVVLKIYDVTGKTVARLSDQKMYTGNHRLNCDLSRFPAGRYNFAMITNGVLKSGSFVKIQ